MNQQLLSEYVDIERRAKALEMEKQTLRGLILEDLKKNKKEKEVSVFGTFTVAKGKSTWEYSQAIKEAEDKIEIKKIRERDKKIAKEIKGTPYLLFKGNE